MCKKILAAMLYITVFLPLALADNVTVHGTVGKVDGQLVTKINTLDEGELPVQVGTVEVWNTEMDMHVVVTPFSGQYLLSKLHIYLDTEPAPPLVPDAYPDLVSDFEALLEDSSALLGETPGWLEAFRDYLEESQSDELGADSFGDLLNAYTALIEALVEALGTVPAALNYYLDSVPVYQESLVEPSFGEWPYSARWKKEFFPGPYSLEVHLSEIAGLQWGQWGEPWLQKRLVTVAVYAELKTTDEVPITFDAWALNPNVSIDLQRTGWGDNALAMRYELQHPKHGTFVGPVHGLNYATPTHGGIVGAEGGFSFFPGETIYFSIGDVFIGSAPAGQRITPLDVFPSLEASDTAVVNLARLFLTLDDDGDSNGPISITEGSAASLQTAMTAVGLDEIDFGNTEEMEALFASLSGASADEASAWLENSIGNSPMRRNVSKSPEYSVDKPKLDIMPIWVPARTASGEGTLVDYLDEESNVIITRDKVKPLFVTYEESQEPNPDAGIVRSGHDIITAVSLDDGNTWKRFNVSHMARKSSFTLEATGERFPGDSRGPQQKLVGDKILVVWTSAYARGGKPSFAIKLDDAYPYDDGFAVNDIWGVRGKQGSVDYDEDKDVGDQGIGEIPYYAVWACRGVLVWEGNASQFPDREIGEIVWFKPERLTSARRDAFYLKVGGMKDVGFAVTWQEDPGGLLPGSQKGGGDGWSGASVHKKTDIWYSYIALSDFDAIDANFELFEPDPMGSDELGPDDHGQQPEISNRPKWLVPMSLAVRVSDNNTVNTDNLKVELDPVTGLPVIDPVTGNFIPLDGALEEDFLASEHEQDGSCDDSTDEHSGNSGTGGGWGMARYAYMQPGLNIADKSGSTAIWNQEIDGDYRPDPAIRWSSFVNKAGFEKTVAVTSDGRILDGDTGACRPFVSVMPGGWVILGYEETKGLGIPPEGDHEESDIEKPEPDDSGKNVIYHSFKLNQPNLVSGGDVLNLPALDDDGNLIPIFYKDAAGLPTEFFRQLKTENARRFRAIPQPKGQIGSTRTVMLAAFRQGREGSGKPGDIIAFRGVVPTTDTKYDNPYRFENLVRLDTSVSNPDANGYNRYQRRHINMSGATVLSFDPVEQAGDGEGNTWNKVGKWKQFGGNLSDETFANPYSDAMGHRGFIRGDKIVLGFSFTPNWGRLGGDHMDFYVRRSFDGGQSWTTDPDGPETVEHTVIERDPLTGEYAERKYQYGRGEFEPGRNVSLLKGNSHTVGDPRLVPPMGQGSTVNPTFPEDDTYNPDIFYVVFGTGKVLHGIGDPLGVSYVEPEDIFYTRTTDGGATFLQVPWVINPDSSSPDVGETVYRWPWLAKGPPHQRHAQVRMHPSGNRFYTIWHQWADGDEFPLSPHDIGNDIWFRRIDFMIGDEPTN